MRILVVEDDPMLRDGLVDLLTGAGHEVDAVADGAEGARLGRDGNHDLVVLDLMLPKLDGIEVCGRLRTARPALPILMLTARGAESDVVDGFRAGADDYVTKPFSVAELMARVEALLRRSGAGDTTGEPFALGGWLVDAVELRARRVGRDVELTRREVELLALFAREPGRILSRRRLLQEIWGFPEPDRVETRTVDMHVAKLRRKLGAAGDALIETVRGEGYRLVS